jgi:hypothetical protein
MFIFRWFVKFRITKSNFYSIILQLKHGHKNFSYEKTALG